MKNFLPLFYLLIAACGNVQHTDEHVDHAGILRSGDWFFSMDIGEEKIPFTASVKSGKSGPVVIIKNASEEIEVTDIVIKNDSVSLTLPVFGSVFSGKMTGDSLLSGNWYNKSRGSDYQIPFTAKAGNFDRFEQTGENPSDFNGKWEVTFNPNDEEPCKAIGIFNQSGQKVTGTFLTEMGDYRFLEGVVSGNMLELSCFDGSHAFLFRSHLNDSGMVMGEFWSGNHWHEEWVARRNDSFQLSHPDSLTMLKEDAAAFSFEFPDLNEKVVSFADNRFKQKVVIIQLMGSWCPNCADESVVFADFYNRFKDKGLEIVAIAYERFDDFPRARQALEHFKIGTGADYLFLYAGKASKQKASEDFPMINGISSFPTAFFIDRNGKIRKIHTGFYGPGTGKYHVEYKEDLELFLEKLLREEVSS